MRMENPPPPSGPKPKPPPAPPDDGSSIMRAGNYTTEAIYRYIKGRLIEEGFALRPVKMGPKSDLRSEENAPHDQGLSLHSVSKNNVGTPPTTLRPAGTPGAQGGNIIDDAYILGLVEQFCNETLQSEGYSPLASSILNIIKAAKEYLKK